MTTWKPRFTLASLLLLVVVSSLLLGAFAWHYRAIAAEQARAQHSLELARAAIDQAIAAESFAATRSSLAADALVDREAIDELAVDPLPEQQPAPTAEPLSTPSHHPWPTRDRLKKYLDSIPAIDTHDHLWPFDQLPGYVETDRGRGMNLSSIWRNSYYGWINQVTPWKPGGSFDDWWAKAKHDFQNARATTFYRYQLPAFQDLYGVDFEQISDDQARALNDRIFENYRDQKWLHHVVTERANIELMFNDPYWARLDFKTTYPFEVLVFNVTTLVRGFHRSEFQKPADDPYHFAEAHQLPVDSLDQYLAVLDRLFATAKERGAVCLKTTLAYQRTLDFANVPKDRAQQVFGRPKTELQPADVKDFEDFIMWRLVELSARYDLPFQIHTGQARIQGSNPMLLVDMIEANPKTKFILFHGGYPWVGETGAILMRHGRHVWIDSVWLPTMSFTMAKRAFHEWLDVMPSDRIMWGADCNHGEGIYGATEMTRRCLAEVLAERVDRGELREDHARTIGKQILRDNALALFPQLKAKLWKNPQN